MRGRFADFLQQVLKFNHFYFPRINDMRGREGTENQVNEKTKHKV